MGELIDGYEHIYDLDVSYTENAKILDIITLKDPDFEKITNFSKWDKTSLLC